MFPRTTSRSAMPVGVQFLLGLISPVAYLALAMCLLGGASTPTDWQPVVAMLLLVFGAIVGVVGIGLRWPGYVAGAFVGVLLMPVMAIAWIFIECGMRI